MIGLGLKGVLDVFSYALVKRNVYITHALFWNKQVWKKNSTEKIK